MPGRRAVGHRGVHALRSIAARSFTPGRPISEAKAELFKVLAHPARVRVLELLAEREHSMGELAHFVGLEPSHLSQHVMQLRRAGIVDD